MRGADVYFNLHRRVWSVKDRATGTVARHARVIVFPFGASFVVGASGRRRVLESGHKTVHAYVRGEDVKCADSVGDWAEWLANVEKLGGCRVTYNPRVAGHFYRKDTGARIDKASAVVMVAEDGKPPVVWAVPHAA